MARNIVRAIQSSGLSIYDPLEDRADLFIDHASLEKILDAGLLGLDLNYQLRTRSKVLKSRICEVLGYPAPTSFRKTRPRFPGQNFDTYIQKAHNLQIWNEEVSDSRRYVVIRVDLNGLVSGVRVITGKALAILDRTGTLTHKYQARSQSPVVSSHLVSKHDTANVIEKLIAARSTAFPGFLPIRQIYKKLKLLVGRKLRDPGIDQERNRGWALHNAVCSQLDMVTWVDKGQFPDVFSQLLEIKMQTASTIDLGLDCPDNVEPIADRPDVYHCDVRYAVFYGTIVGPAVRLDHLVPTTGADFFNFFRRFGGRVTNSKLQIRLPIDFFD
jgi:hypothetical protein